MLGQNCKSREAVGGIRLGQLLADMTCMDVVHGWNADSTSKGKTLKVLPTGRACNAASSPCA
eukprot:5423531-Pleurochrysis_carterae.AAC.2